MNNAITMNDIVEIVNSVVKIAIVLAALWGFYELLVKIVTAITKRHDKEKRWDEMETKFLTNIQEERDKIYANYDPKLEDIHEKIDQVRSEIETTHCETEAKMQELLALVTILTKGQVAALDGLKQLNCNGRVTEMKSELDEFLQQRALDI